MLGEVAAKTPKRRRYRYIFIKRCSTHPGLDIISPASYSCSTLECDRTPPFDSTRACMDILFLGDEIYFNSGHASTVRGKRKRQASRNAACDKLIEEKRTNITNSSTSTAHHRRTSAIEILRRKNNDNSVACSGRAQSNPRKRLVSDGHAQINPRKKFTSDPDRRSKIK